MERQGDDHEIYDEQIVGPIREESAAYVQQMKEDGVDIAAQHLRELRSQHPSIRPSVPLIPTQSKED